MYEGDRDNALPTVENRNTDSCHKHRHVFSDGVSGRDLTPSVVESLGFWQTSTKYGASCGLSISFASRQRDDRTWAGGLDAKCNSDHLVGLFSFFFQFIKAVTRTSSLQAFFFLFEWERVTCALLALHVPTCHNGIAVTFGP